MKIYDGMEKSGKQFKSVEDYVVYASINLNQLIKDTINKTIEAMKRQLSVR